MKKYNKKKIKKFTILILILVIITTTFFITKIYLNKKKEEALIKKNYALLQKLENRDINNIEKKLSEDGNSNNNKTESYEKIQKQISNKSNKLFFENSVFMGDSITEALEFYNILNSSSVLAKKGQDVIKARKSVPQLKNLNPKRIFILYGENDLELFSNPKDFEDNYTKLVKDIKTALPNSQIYLQSVMPAQPKAQQRNKKLSNFRSSLFLDVVKRVAKKEKVNFIDIRPVIANKNYLYERDGIHFNAKFYSLWLNYLRQKL